MFGGQKEIVLLEDVFTLAIVTHPVDTMFGAFVLV
jgi:hypothetical protein